ncbi:LD-carboxypeptidase [Aquimarina sp. 2201CG5-10]|uniref:S66 peptidase family protein n=1 Tax=Aquimarina callyspongiae TaxID=3098150 RepID=UPI002AB4E956|nr:LD-carboxypeptidase [Aquimarina sp. 2201CG5-10]MDY8136995.1 LD-carboxypeptidase [Aquimarina sp. 2201CG5-10]
MFKPGFLKEGSKIAIVSTARKISLREIAETISIIKAWGLVPVIGKTIGLDHNQFAGTDEERRSDFQDKLDDPDIDAIWCARGGYGTVRIVDMLDFSGFLKKPKWIIGYSDVTVLHAHIHKLQIATLHAPMPIDFHKGTTASQKSFKEIIFGNKISYSFSSSEENKIGNCSGQLIGGNLSILYSLCGSLSSIDTTGKILCIEDLDEYLYHIDRMLQNLKRNGYFDKLSGLIVGGMTKMHDNNIPFGRKAEEIILDIVADYDFPVVFNFPMGHIEDNRTLMLGAEVSLTVTKKMAQLEYI